MNLPTDLAATINVATDAIEALGSTIAATLQENEELKAALAEARAGRWPGAIDQLESYVRKFRAQRAEITVLQNRCKQLEAALAAWKETAA